MVIRLTRPFKPNRVIAAAIAAERSNYMILMADTAALISHHAATRRARRMHLIPAGRRVRLRRVRWRGWANPSSRYGLAG